MGSEYLSENEVSSANINIRNKVLKTDTEKNQRFPQRFDDEFSKDIALCNKLDFDRNKLTKMSLEEDFVWFKSSTEGNF